MIHTQPGKQAPGLLPAGTNGDARGSDLPCRILVVDDHDDCATSTMMLLRIWGHTAEKACDAPSAIAAAPRFRPHVVLLDLGLPHANGYDVAREIRSLPGLEDTRFVAVTGHGRAEDVERSRREGIHHHLVKPVDPETLQALLADCMRGGNGGH